MTAPTYDQVHNALKRERGSAVGLPCSHPVCDRPSTGWALLDHPTHIVVNSHGKPVRISTDLDAYGPACTRHNAQRTTAATGRSARTATCGPCGAPTRRGRAEDASASAAEPPTSRWGPSLIS